MSNGAKRKSGGAKRDGKGTTPDTAPEGATWHVVLPSGGTFEVQDLPPAMVIEISKTSNVSWRIVVDAPGADLETGLAVLRAVATVADEDFTEPRTTREAIKLLTDRFRLMLPITPAAIADAQETIAELDLDDADRATT